MISSIKTFIIHHFFKEIINEFDSLSNPSTFFFKYQLYKRIIEMPAGYKPTEGDFIFITAESKERHQFIYSWIPTQDYLTGKNKKQ